jgi:hypothetical protein
LWIGNSHESSNYRIRHPRRSDGADSPFEEFADAIEAASRRLETEGVEELVALHFYGSPVSTEVGAILTFSNRDHMIDHLEMISAWEEFERFFATVKPLDVRVYGKLSEEAEEWIGHFDVLSKKFERHFAGFVR